MRNPLSLFRLSSIDNTRAPADLEAMLPDLSRHDEEGFTVFDSRERRESALSTEPLSKRLNRLAPGAVEDSRM